MAKQREGICKLCGQRQLLTFEHVPPHSAFNNQPAKRYPFEESLKLFSGADGRLPWDFDGLVGKTNQRGMGDYYLCQSCNNNTGNWYISEYSKLVHTFAHILQSESPNERNEYSFTVYDVYPSRIAKALLVMFCDINHNCFNDEELRRFLLDRECSSLKNNRYSLFLYLTKSSMPRLQGLSVINKNGVSFCVSEIASSPWALRYTLISLIQ